MVDNSGSANYTVPLRVPPGTAGIEPELSLNYRSGGRNGPLGVGWSLGGLSAITRIPATLGSDGFVAPVDFTVTDRFQMDGQRLVMVGDPEEVGYGGPDTWYRTEVESFTAIKASGATGDAGPVSFEARTKSGRVYFMEPRRIAGCWLKGAPTAR